LRTPQRLTECFPNISAAHDEDWLLEVPVDEWIRYTDIALTNIRELLISSNNVQ
jgi:hypothetical protein